MASIISKRTLGMIQSVRVSRHSAAISRHFETSSMVLQQATAAVAGKPSPEDVTVKPTSEIPGPRRLPIIGTVYKLLFDSDFDPKKIHIFWKKMIKEYGPIVRLDAPFIPPMIMLANPDDCEIVARTTMDNPVRMGFFALARIRKDAVDNYFEKKCGLLTENNEEWKRVRSRVQTPMMKSKNVTSYLTQMDQIALDFMERIASLQKEFGEMPSDFQTELYKWALESVSLVALNRRMGCLEPNLASDSEPMTLINQANNIFAALNGTEMSIGLWRIFPTSAYKKLQKSHDEFLKIADQNIKKTEAQLLAKKSTSEEDLTLMETLLLTPGLSRKDVVTLILDMLFAGIDTTSHTIGFTLYLLAKNPKCQAKLQEEIDTVLGNHEGPITTKQLAKLSYLKAVVKESLRVFPLTVGTARTLQQDTVLSGYLVPKGFAAVTLNMFMGHDEQIFPQAKEFIPERWLRHKPLGPIHPYASLPFGIGTRMCIGRRIAEQELYTFLIRVMQRFSVDYKYQDMDITTRMVFVPSEPLRFTFTERS